jgi:hypothetical protein
MSNVLNKITLQYLQFVNTPDYDTNIWIINPDLSAVVDLNSKFWKLIYDPESIIQDGYSVVPMTQEEQDVVIAAERALIIPRMTGDYFQAVKDDIESSTTSKDWTTKLNLNTRQSPAGQYVISWNALCNSSVANKNVDVRIVLDDIVFTSKTTRFVKALTDGSVSGSMTVVLGAGIHIITMQYRVSSDGLTAANIRNTSLLIWRI